MNETMVQQFTDGLVRLSVAAEALEGALVKLQAQQEELSVEVGRIVATIDERLPKQEVEVPQSAGSSISARITELERANEELKAQAARLGRKTLSPLTSALLVKSGCHEGTDNAALDQALSSLAPDQRIAVKAEMARAGLLA